MSQHLVRNGKGQIVYRTNTPMEITKVYDDHDVPLRWSQNGQTRVAQGTLIAQGTVPELLVPER